MPPDYQNLVPPHPRFPLTSLPSPLDRAKRLEQALRDEGCASVPHILIKRDNMLSLGLGGNKIRNLEFSIGQALSESATDIVTAGRQQSNHCRLTAAACARAGLRAHLVLNGTPPAHPAGNLLLDHLFDARLYFTASDNRERRTAWIETLVATFSMFAGRKPFVIPVGGSNVRGALGHVLAAGEIAAECDALGVRPDAIVLATATGGTQAGLIAGLRKLGRPTRVFGFAVAKSAAELADDVRRILDGVAIEVGLPSPDSTDVVVSDAMLGGGYGVASTAARDAITMLARTEGLVADPVYTGKGFAGLLAMIRSGAFTADETVIFIHTGGAPALFA